MIEPLTASRFRLFGILTIIAVYVVILAGGTVRASGAGMGCPDWPTCFGQWIPPTEESQLPSNYHEIYAQRGYETTTFNPVKTWTEYTNRLIGATTGILLIMTVWFSRVYLKSDKTTFYLALTSLFIVGFQSWLGSAVVASNLKPFMITLHMLMALLIVALLIYTLSRSQKTLLAQQNSQWASARFKTVLKIAVGMTLLQIAMGVQVREAVDYIANQHDYIERQYWRDSFPIIFYVHRSFSSIILFTNLWLVWTIHKNAEPGSLLTKTAYTLACLIVTAILAGVSLDRLGFPAFAQPIHLLMANLIFGAQFFLFMCLHYSAQQNQAIKP